MLLLSVKYILSHHLNSFTDTDKQIFRKYHDPSIISVFHRFYFSGSFIWKNLRCRKLCQRIQGNNQHKCNDEIDANERLYFDVIDQILSSFICLFQTIIHEYTETYKQHGTCAGTQQTQKRKLHSCAVFYCGGRLLPFLHIKITAQ